MSKKAFVIEELTGLMEEVPVEVVDKAWYRRPANYQLGQFEKDMESKREVSLTVPNQSYTIREILDKFTRGLPLDVVQEGKFENPEDFVGESIENAVDITDVEIQLAEANLRVNALKAQAIKLKSAKLAEAEDVAKRNNEAEVKKADEAKA